MWRKIGLVKLHYEELHLIVADIYIYIYVCVCVCVSARVCVHARVCERELGGSVKGMLIVSSDLYQYHGPNKD